MKLCVLLVGEHTLIRTGLNLMLKSIPGIDVVSEADNQTLTFQLLQAHCPDVLVMDVDAAHMDCLAMAEQVGKQHSRVRTLLLLAPTTQIDLQRVFRCGAHGCVPRDVELAELRSALDALHHDKFYVSPELSNQFLRAFQKENGDNDSLSRLTQRQRDVLRLLAEGLGTKEIAGRLKIGPRTVETHRGRIMKRLDIHDVVGLVHFAIRNGLVVP